MWSSPHGALTLNSQPGTTRTPSVAPSAAAEGATLGVRRSEEHTSELQSLRHLVCRLLLEKKKKKKKTDVLMNLDSNAKEDRSNTKDNHQWIRCLTNRTVAVAKSTQSTEKLCECHELEYVR